jgi:hypothetical protein
LIELAFWQKIEISSKLKDRRILIESGWIETKGRLQAGQADLEMKVVEDTAP